MYLSLECFLISVKTCGWLNIPNSVKKEPYSYTVGSTVTITGCKSGYVLEGQTRTYTCNAGASGAAPSWTPAVDIKCKGIKFYSRSIDTLLLSSILFCLNDILLSQSTISSAILAIIQYINTLTELFILCL